MSKKDEIELAMQQVRGVRIVYLFLKLSVLGNYLIKITDVSNFTH